MTKWNPSILLKSHLVVIITAVCPTVIFIILYKEIYILFEEDYSLTYGNYKYPVWSNWIGWLIALVSISSIPIGMIHQIGVTLFSTNNSLTPSKPFKHQLASLIKPTEHWWRNADTNTSTRHKTELNGHATMNGHTNQTFTSSEF